MSSRASQHSHPTEFLVDVLEPGASRRRGSIPCLLGTHVQFSAEALELFASRNWDTTVYDALVVTAAIEFCDRRFRRGVSVWGRSFDVRLQVHDPDLWNGMPVGELLHTSLRQLTGDKWNLSFCPRRASIASPAQERLEFPTGVHATVPFSDGMDSLAVSCLEERRLDGQVVRVRVVRGRGRLSAHARRRAPFAALPYRVLLGRDNAEASARSRGFKFCMVASLAAYLVDAPTVIVPESGQGALGPALAVTGHTYPDYRNHPVFTSLVAGLIDALFHHSVSFAYPQLWRTKGETLLEFVSSDTGCDASAWMHTRSCWQQSRQVSVSGQRRQCGICAACLLRRLSVHTAGLAEPPETYVWEDLRARTFTGGVSSGFPSRKVTPALHDYALAGALHLDHLADFDRLPALRDTLGRHSIDLAGALGCTATITKAMLERLIRKHREEWDNFVDALGPKSFIASWLR